MGKKLKLTIELVPSSSWDINLRSLLTKPMWDNLRKSIYKKYDYRCAICGNGGKLHAHEVWEYDDKNHIQKLKDLIAICYKCHQVKHIGFTSLQLSESGKNYEDVIKHFMRVNNCDRLIFQKHLKEETKKNEERSRYEWILDFEDYKSKKATA